METKLRVLIADTTDPYFNLATEDWIFNDMAPDSRVLFLWRNEPSIIIGRGQNVWSECLLEEAKKDGVHIVRRHSGGGAVYQDLGNTCFTFMRPRAAERTTKELYQENNQILLNALARLGVSATTSGRNDLVVEKDGQVYKVSGSAFKENKDRCFHHGTMLMDVDLGRLARYLTPDSKKLKAKGIKSVAARVVNLTEIVKSIEHHSFCQAVIEAFFQHYEATAEVEHLDRNALDQVTSLSDYYQKLRSWDWVFGKTPAFQHTMKERFSWGSIELHLDTSQGQISEVAIYTDSLQPELFEDLAQHLTGRSYSREGFAQAKTSHLAVSPSVELEQVYDWGSTQL